MLVKKIVCTVEPSRKVKFSLAQEQWVRMEDAPGLIAQVGGWDAGDATQAIIFSFWKSQHHLDRFMENLHDDIFLSSGQSATYTSIEVRYLSTQSAHFQGDMVFTEVLKASTQMTVGYSDWSHSKELQKSCLGVLDVIERLKKSASVYIRFWDASAKNLQNPIHMVDSWKVMPGKNR